VNIIKSVISLLRPSPSLKPGEVSQGLLWLTLEGAASMGFSSITSSGLLASFALALGASSFIVGIIAAIPFVAQILQIPAVGLVERIRLRKAISVLSWLPAQLIWIPIAFIPFLAQPGALAVSLLLIFLAMRSALSAVTNAAWNSWMRDLVPPPIRGKFFSNRLLYSTVIASVLSIGAALFIDFWQSRVPASQANIGYSYVLFTGVMFLGMASPVFMSMAPEPRMPARPARTPPIWKELSSPLRDSSFRPLVAFLFSWAFASNLAIPFFAVYMLTSLGLPLAAVMGLTVLSQMFNILFLRRWGVFVDRFSSKTVLSLCLTLYILAIGVWAFSSLQARHLLFMPILLLVHILAGIATAGISVATATIGLKLAPDEKPTAYLAAASMATNIGSGVGPIAGGLLALLLAPYHFSLNFSLNGPLGFFNSTYTLFAMRGMDFLFGIAFFASLGAFALLSFVRERGEIPRRFSAGILFSPPGDLNRPMSSVPAFNPLSNFPFRYLRGAPIPVYEAVGVTLIQFGDIFRGLGIFVTRVLRAILRRPKPPSGNGRGKE
jgi:MFS family permease